MCCKIQRKTKGYILWKANVPPFHPSPLLLFPGATGRSQVLPIVIRGDSAIKLWFLIFIIVQANLRLMILLLQPGECWDCRHIPHHQCNLLPGCSLCSKQLSARLGGSERLKHWPCFESLEVKPPIPVEFIWEETEEEQKVVTQCSL